MSRFGYNGYELQLWQTADYEVTALYNGPDFIGKKYTIIGSGYLNPSASSFKENKWSQQAPGQAESGHLAPESLRAIEQELLTPRKRLVFFQDNTSNGAGRLVVSPMDPSQGEDQWDFDTHLSHPTAPGITDAANGPIPLFARAQSISGIKTLRVSVGYETTLYEEWQDKWLREPVLLSNRYGMRHSYDRQFFCTRTTRGRAVFNTSRLQSSNTSPDDYRGILCPPLPNGFRRMGADFILLPDGMTVEYVVVDQQLPFLVTDPNIAWIECIHTKRRSVPARGSSVISSAGGIWDALKKGFTEDWLHGNFGTTPNSEAFSGALGDTFASLFGSLPGIGSAVLGGKLAAGSKASGLGSAGASAALGGIALLVSSELPLYMEQLHIEVYGTPNVSRQYLNDTALTILNDRLSGIVGSNLFGSDISITHDDTRRIVTLDASYINGITAKLTDAFFGVNGTPGGWPASEAIPGMTNNIGGTAGTTGTSLPNERNTRESSYLGILAASALNLDGSPITAPADVRSVNPQSTGSPALP